MWQSEETFRDRRVVEERFLRSVRSRLEGGAYNVLGDAEAVGRQPQIRERGQLEEWLVPVHVPPEAGGHGLAVLWRVAVQLARLAGVTHLDVSGNGTEGESRGVEV